MAQINSYLKDVLNRNEERKKLYEDKIRRLKNIFPTIEEDDIYNALKRFDFNIQDTSDYLIEGMHLLLCNN